MKSNSTSSGQSSSRYGAFISYSHAADGRLAPALQEGLQRLAKPWYRLRALRVFRDKTGLGVTPALWDSIELALSGSAYFILLASPDAAQSKWVEQEVDWWLRNRSPDRLIIVWTDGEVEWNDALGDFEWPKSTALPQRLQGAFLNEPLYLDLRWAKSAEDLSLRRPRFADAVARIAATLRGISLDELTGEDVKQHQRTIRLLRVAVATLLILTLSAVVTALVAINARRMVEPLARKERDAARLQADEVKSRRLAATALNLPPTERELAILLAAEALRAHATAEAESALKQMLAAPLEPALILGTGGKSGFGAVFAPDGNKVLAWDPDGAPQIFDATTAKKWTELNGHTGIVRRACYSDDGKRIVTAGEDGFVRIWDAHQAKTLLTLAHPLVSAAFPSPDGSRIASVALSRDLMLWDTASGAKIAEVDYSQNMILGDQVRDAAFSPDGTRLAWCERFQPAILDTRSGKVILRLEGHTKPISSIVYSSDGQWILTASEDGTVRRWRSATGASQAIFPHTTELHEAQFSPDGKWIAARDRDNAIVVWDAMTGKNVALIEILPKPAHPVFFVFSPNGKCLLAADFSSDTARLFETSTGSGLGTLVGREGEIRTLDFSADGLRVLVGSVFAPPRIYSSEICGPPAALLELARRRVLRTLTPAERSRYTDASERP